MDDQIRQQAIELYDRFTHDGMERRDFFAAMQPCTEGAVYVNGLGVEGEERVREAYGGNYPRLAAIKATYDPDNLFHGNQNIRPRGQLVP